VLKPGGQLAVNVLLEPVGEGVLARIARAINRWGMRKGILVRPYEQAEVEQLFRAAGFEISFVQRSGNCLNLLARRPVA